MTLGELIETESPALPDEREAALQSAAVRKAVLRLPPKTRVIVIMRFGLDDKGQRTLEVIGRRVGTSREMVCRIVGEALETMRRFLSGATES